MEHGERCLHRTRRVWFKGQSDPVASCNPNYLFQSTSRKPVLSPRHGHTIQGTGIPRRSVTAYIDTNPANSTVVKEDSRTSSYRQTGSSGQSPHNSPWALGPIEGAQISDGSDDDGSLPWGLISAPLLVLAALGALGARSQDRWYT